MINDSELQQEVIIFNEETLCNWKAMVQQQKQEICLLQEQNLQYKYLVNQMYSKFNAILHNYEQGYDDVISNHLKILGEVQTTPIGQNISESHFKTQTDSDHQLPQKQFQLQIQIKTLENTISQLRDDCSKQQLQLQELFVQQRILEKENIDLKQQKFILENQFRMLLTQFEEYQKFQTESQLQWQQPLLKHPNSTLTTDSFSNSLDKGRTIPNGYIHQTDQILQQQSKALSKASSQSNFQEENEFQVNTRLQEFLARKQKYELNKKITSVKTFAEKRKREQVEQELEHVIEEINKLKLRLREYKIA